MIHMLPFHDAITGCLFCGDTLYGKDRVLAPFIE
jgi:hypothetical protein